MSNQPSVEQLKAIVRVLSNTEKFLTNGLFPGANAHALLEAQGYIKSLHQQSEEALQSQVDSESIKNEEAKSEQKGA